MIDPSPSANVCLVDIAVIQLSKLQAVEMKVIGVCCRKSNGPFPRILHRYPN